MAVWVERVVHRSSNTKQRRDDAAFHHFTPYNSDWRKLSKLLNEHVLARVNKCRSIDLSEQQQQLSTMGNLQLFSAFALVFIYITAILVSLSLARCVETPRFATAAMSARISSLFVFGAHAEEHLAWQINYSLTLSTLAAHVERLGALPKNKSWKIKQKIF